MPPCSASAGRSLPTSWRCSAIVDVATTTFNPDATAGTRYAKLLPDPVGASATR